MPISGTDLSVNKGLSSATTPFTLHKSFFGPITSLSNPPNSQFKIGTFGHSFAARAATDDGSTVKFLETCPVTFARHWSNLMITFNEDDNYGTSGDTIAQSAARVTDMAAFDGDAIVCFLATNSINASVAINDILSDFDTIQNYIVNTINKKMIVMSELTRGDSTAAKITATAQYNTHAYNAADNVNTFFVDWNRDVIDPNDG